MNESPLVEVKLYFYTGGKQAEGLGDVMFPEHLCSGEEQPNTAVTARLCLAAGYEESDLCPPFHRHVKLFLADEK